MNSGELRFLVSAEAKDDTEEVFLYLALQNEIIGERFVSALAETYDFLLQNPGVGRMRGFSSIYGGDLRQWPVRSFSNYLIFYATFDDGIEILRILHGARNLPEILN